MQPMPPSYRWALHYDWLTPFYDLWVRLAMRAGVFKRRLIETANIQPGHWVLDLGCGTGTLLCLIDAMVPDAKLVGLDADPHVLAIAQRKLTQAWGKAALDRGFSYALPYPDQSFDRVVSSLFFHHLSRDDKRRTLDEIYAVLRPGGELHVADFGMPRALVMRWASYLVQLFDGFETATDNKSGLRPSMMSEAGFDQVEETTHFSTLFGTVTLIQATKLTRT